MRASQITNFISSAVRVRASVKSILCPLFFFLAFVSPLLADEVFTNVMSPVVSYQFYDSLEHLDTNSVIMSPVASYQYFDWPDAGSVQFLNSPAVSYFYPFLLFRQHRARGRKPATSAPPWERRTNSTDGNPPPPSGVSTSPAIFGISAMGPPRR